MTNKIPTCPTCSTPADVSIIAKRASDVPPLTRVHDHNGAWLHGLDDSGRNVVVYWVPASVPKKGDTAGFTFDANHNVESVSTIIGG